MFVIAVSLFVFSDSYLLSYIWRNWWLLWFSWNA